MNGIDVSEFEGGLQQLLGLLSSFREPGQTAKSGFLDSRQKLVLGVIRELSKSPMGKGEIAKYLLNRGITKSTSFAYARKITQSICHQNAEGKYVCKKEVKIVLGSLEKTIDISLFTFEQYDVEQEGFIFKFNPIEWLAFLSVATGFELPRVVGLLKDAIEKVEKKSGKVIKESDLIYEISRILEAKYQSREAKRVNELHATEIFHFHTRTVTPFDLRKATGALITDLGQDSRRYVLEALWKLRQVGIRRISPFAFKMWVLTYLCNLGAPYEAVVDALMWYGISKSDYERLTSKYLDEDYAIASEIRRSHITISILDAEEFAALHDGDIWVHYLTQSFGIKPIMASLNSYEIVNQGIFGHKPPDSVQVARSHLIQTLFTYPPVASDLSYDALNYAFAKFANKSNTWIGNDLTSRKYIQDEVSQQMQAILCEMDHFLNWPAGKLHSSISVSLTPMIGFPFDESKNEFALHIVQKLLKLLEYGDEGRSFTYPRVFLKFSAKDGVDEDIQRLISSIYLKRKKTRIYLINTDYWQDRKTPTRVVFGEYQNSITSKTENWINEIYNTGICGLVTVNLPRMALEEKTKKAGDEFLERSVRTAIGILEKNKKLIMEKHSKRASTVPNTIPFRFDNALHYIGVIGLREYLEFSGLDPLSNPNESVNEGVRVLSEIEKILQTEVERKQLDGRFELAQSFAPYRVFLWKDKKKFGALPERKLAPLHSYTPGCSLFTDRVYTIERCSGIPSDGKKEMKIFNLTEGGAGSMFNFRMGSDKRWNNEDVMNILNSLIKNGPPLFSLSIPE